MVGRNFLTIVICVMLCLIGTAMFFFCLGLDDAQKRPVENCVETVDNSVENCEHDWVVASEYSWYRNAYRIISKCSKCGKVVK